MRYAIVNIKKKLITLTNTIESNPNYIDGVVLVDFILNDNCIIGKSLCFDFDYEEELSKEEIDCDIKNPYRTYTTIFGNIKEKRTHYWVVLKKRENYDLTFGEPFSILRL